MKKKKYIKPEIEIIVTKVEQYLLAGTPAGGHGGGSNPGDTPDPPATTTNGYYKSITADPVGFTGSQWIDKENSNAFQHHSVWE